MNEVAFITLPVSADCGWLMFHLITIDFKKPIPQGTIVELVEVVSHVGNAELKFIIYPDIIS